MMLPMLLMGENNSTDSLMLMMMMQTMGNQPFNMEQVKKNKLSDISYIFISRLKIKKYLDDALAAP